MKKTSASLVACVLPFVMGAPAFADHHEEAGPKVEKVAATVLGVSDLNASVELYKSALGMTVVRTTSTDTYEEAILATADADGTKIVLYQSLVESDGPLKTGRVVFYTSDAVSLVEAFRDAGLEVEREATPVAEGSPVRIGIVHDADGHTLEFIQRG
ncbi:VOC family protein [Henriciella sp. AS95]|uniref:VOC family protein n=1 Tax=Henriciella sp. AS95 TaxID=3135782 RepID=UPI003174E351